MNKGAGTFMINFQSNEILHSTVCIVLISLVVIVVSKIANAHMGKEYSTAHVRKSRSLVRQAMQWHAAAEQDSNQLFSSRHSNYAVAYLNAARSMLPDDMLERATNVDIHELSNALELSQREHTKSLSQSCPKSNPSGKVSSAQWL